MTSTTNAAPGAPTTSGTSTGASTGASTDRVLAEHTAWHATRERNLREPHGWLTLTGLLWLPGTPGELPGLPGLWWADEDGAHTRGVGRHRAAEGTEVTTHVVDEGASRIVGTFLPEGRSPDGPGSDEPGGPAEPAEVAIELVRRTGRYAIRPRDPLAPTRVDFDGVPTFAYDPAWVLDAPVRWYDEPRPVVVGAAQPGLEHHVRVVGEVDLPRPDGSGDPVTLRLTGTPGGAVTLLFSDDADGTAPWRVLWVDVPDTVVDVVGGGTRSADDPAVETVRLDLNRTLNLPYAFTDFGTCPAPVEGNHVPFAVVAGERAPR